MITNDVLQSILLYEPSTGEFIWKRSIGSVTAGKTAGRKNNEGYLSIGINGKSYLAHRLAWLYVYGTFPALEIDHINRVKTDNRLANLRTATRKQNCENRLIRRDSSMPYKGIGFMPESGTWRARIYVQGKAIYLGRFKTPEEASVAYETKASELFSHKPVMQHQMPGTINGSQDKTHRYL